MRLYIDYKYSNVHDKGRLISELGEFSKGLEKTGNTTFVLGRDIQKWSGSLPLYKTFFPIVYNMLNSNYFVSFETENVASRGLAFEKHLATLLGKPRIYAIKRADGPLSQSNLIDIRSNTLNSKRIYFEDTQDAVDKIVGNLA